MQFIVSGVDGEFVKAITGFRKPVAAAATAAVREAGELALSRGRANIASAGFSKRWQDGLVCEFFPKGGRSSLRPLAVIRHTIGYSGVFEEGATIEGKPLLWLPLPTLPAGSGRSRMTPRRFIAQGGKLASVNRPGRRPLLVGKLRAARQAVPLFVGVDAVNIRKRFRIAEIVRAAASRLGEFYAKNVRP